MTYDYRGKKITLDDKLVEKWKQVWFGMEPDEALFDGYISLEFQRDDFRDELKRFSDEQVSKIISKYMFIDIE